MALSVGDFSIRCQNDQFLYGANGIDFSWDMEKGLCKKAQKIFEKFLTFPGAGQLREGAFVETDGKYQNTFADSAFSSLMKFSAISYEPDALGFSLWDSSISEMQEREAGCKSKGEGVFSCSISNTNQIRKKNQWQKDAGSQARKAGTQEIYELKLFDGIFKNICEESFDSFLIRNNYRELYASEGTDHDCSSFDLLDRLSMKGDFLVLEPADQPSRFDRPLELLLALLFMGSAVLQTVVLRNYGPEIHAAF